MSSNGLVMVDCHEPQRRRIQWLVIFILALRLELVIA